MIIDYFKSQLDTIDDIAYDLLKTNNDKISNEQPHHKRNYFEHPLSNEEIDDLLIRIPSRGITLNVKLLTLSEKEVTLVKSAKKDSSKYQKSIDYNVR